MTETRTFHIGDILTITTGRLVSPRHVDGIYDILNFMTGDNLFTHQLPRGMDECAPSLREQFPDLAAIVVPDDLGSKEYNDALCIRRADAVKQALLDLGVAPRQIRLSTRYGYEKAPPEPCPTEACRKRLRRVELRFDSTTLAH